MPSSTPVCIPHGTLEACPECGSENVAPINEAVWPAWFGRVECIECGYRPDSDWFNVSDAVRDWQALPREEQHG